MHWEITIAAIIIGWEEIKYKRNENVINVRIILFIILKMIDFKFFLSFENYFF